MELTNKQPLDVLRGEQLSSVQFVQDYVQLHFDGLSLISVTHPKVKVGGIWFKWGDPGYRDMLCELIGRIVRMAFVREGEEICVLFDDQACISISLHPEDYRAAEAAILTNGPEETWLW